jgi:hypothetical protein
MSMLKEMAYLSGAVSRPEEACADNMGVYWYVCKE